MRKTLSITLSESEYRTLRDLALARQVAMGAIIRDAIGQYLANGVVVVPVRGLLDSSTRLPDVG
jgi:hypothetical protein